MNNWILFALYICLVRDIIFCGMDGDYFPLKNAFIRFTSDTIVTRKPISM